jgi:hypothetical protein
VGLGPMPAGVPGGGLPPGMGAPPGGAPPPGGQAPPSNLGPHTIPQNNPGNAMQAMAKIQQATQLLQEALPQIPMGSEGHQKLMKIVSDLTKQVGEAKASMQQQIQQLLQHVQAQKAAQANGGGAMQPPPPNQGPAMAPPGGGAPPPGGM